MGPTWASGGRQTKAGGAGTPTSCLQAVSTISIPAQPTLAEHLLLGHVSLLTETQTKSGLWLQPLQAPQEVCL